MFAHPSLNAVFSRHFDGFFIISKYSEIEIFLKNIANLLSRKHLVLYISTDDCAGLNENIYHLNIFNEPALKRLKKLKNIDFIIVENITFLSQITLPKSAKIIANGFCKDDLRHFASRKTRLLKFFYCERFFCLYNENCQFRYNFKSRNEAIFRPNKLPKDIDRECEFYLDCLEQGFRFYDGRKRRYDELLRAFANSNIYLNYKAIGESSDSEYFYLNQHKIRCDFFHKSCQNLRISSVPKILEAEYPQEF